MGSDRYRIQWAFDLEKDFVARNGEPPLRPSHWNAEDPDLSLPPINFEGVFDDVRAGLRTYQFPQYMMEVRDAVARCVAADPVDGVVARTN